MWQINKGGWPVISSLDELTSVLFKQRGLSKVSSQHFFESQYDRDIHNPYLLRGMDIAVDRIFRAIKKGERIMVYGDYDADGITATAILITALQDMGANAVPFLPHRFEHGYGVNGDILKQLAPEIDLFITVDCGVSNGEEIAWLKKEGIDSIIVDHHELPDELPDALAVLHPRHPDGEYPFAYLSGAGMSWKLAQALVTDERSPLSKDKDYIKWLLDLALMGTVGDVVALLGENRAIVRFGLEVMKRTRRPGLAALLSKARLSRDDITAEAIAWRLVSKLNAAGRMDHPQPALNLLLAKDKASAETLALVLEKYNRDRQTVTKKILSEAKLQMKHDLPVIFVSNIKWSAGVVGLAAGRLADEYGKPAIVVGGNGRHAVGSARSPVGSNVLSILKAHENLMMKLGGHTQAAGFSVDPKKLAELGEAIDQYEVDVKDGLLEKPRVADVALCPSLISQTTFDLLRQFEPFGEGNKKPVFVSQDMSLVDLKLVGKSKDHVKFTWETPKSGIVEGIGFGLAEKADSLGKKTDILFQLDQNEWMGRKSLQLQVKDIAAAKSVNILK